MDYKEQRKIQKENKKFLETSCDILIDISKKPKNRKFVKMPFSELNRAKYLRRDNKEKNTRFKKYKKGTVIFVDFGIGIGNEFSHPHFAIVMDNKDNPLKGTLNVVPLTSKENKKFIDLGTDLISKILNTVAKEALETQELVNSIFQLEDSPFTIKGAVYYPEDKHNQLILDNFTKRHSKTYRETINGEDVRKWIKLERDQLKDIVEFYSKYNKNTYAKPENITTISKFRIMKPINALDPIGRVQLDKLNIKKIEERIIKSILSV